MRKATTWLSLIVLLVGTGALVINFYSYLFAKSVDGQIIGIERVTYPAAIIGNNVPSSQVYSFAVAVRAPSGEIFTGSTEDRQWAVAQKNQCVEAKFFPYPPWDLDKGSTYFNVRLIKLHDCPGASSIGGSHAP